MPAREDATPRDRWWRYPKLHERNGIIGIIFLYFRCYLKPTTISSSSSSSSSSSIWSLAPHTPHCFVRYRFDLFTSHSCSRSTLNYVLAWLNEGGNRSIKQRPALLRRRRDQEDADPTQNTTQYKLFKDEVKNSENAVESHPQYSKRRRSEAEKRKKGRKKNKGRKKRAVLKFYLFWGKKERWKWMEKQYICFFFFSFCFCF